MGSFGRAERDYSPNTAWAGFLQESDQFAGRGQFISSLNLVVVLVLAGNGHVRAKRKTSTTAPQAFADR
jgi:hypothetical protein